MVAKSTRKRRWVWPWVWGGTVYIKIVQALLYGVVVVLPLFYLPFTTGILEHNKQLLLVIAMAIALMVWLLGVVVSGTMRVRRAPIDKGVYAVLIVSVLASIFSLTPAKSIFGMSLNLSSSLISVAALSVFYFLAVNTVHDRGAMLKRAFALSVMLALIIGICQVFAWHFLLGAFTHVRSFNTIGSLNTLGFLAAICIPIFAKMHTQRSWGDMALSIGGVFVSLLVLAVLNWWVLWAVALTGMIAMIGFDSTNTAALAEEYGSSGKRWALSRFVIPVTVIVLGAFLLLVNFNPATLKSHLPAEVTPSFRLSFNVAKEVMRERLMLGYGPENFSLAFDKFGASELAGTQFSSMRFMQGASTVLTAAVEMGVLGLLALLVLLGSLVQVIVRATKASPTFESSGILSAVIALAVGLFLYPINLTIAFVWYFLLVLAALATASDRSATINIEERPMYSLSASLAFIIALILVLSGVHFLAMMYVGDAYYAHALQASDSTSARALLTKAMDYDSKDDRYLRDDSQLGLKFLRDEIAKKPVATDTGRAARIQNMISSLVKMAQGATILQPHESLNWNNLGLVYQALTGVIDDVEQLAEDAFVYAGSLRPGDPAFDNQIGTVWLNRADHLRQLARGSADAGTLNDQADKALQKAEDAFNRAIHLSPTFGLAVYNLGMVYDRQGKISDAIYQLERIVPEHADDVTLIFQLGLLYIRNGQKENALTAMQRVVMLSPQYADARWYYALILEDKGDIEGALANLKEIQMSNTDNAILNEKIKQLESGQHPASSAEVIDSKPLE